MANGGSLAVLVQNASKSYGQKEILKELCMHVPAGAIYGLLGASGCGKTTLLSCIVGRKKLNSGEVQVLGAQPGMEGSGVPGPKVGYMPQETGLVAEFTVRDSVFYFGRIYDMPDRLIEERFRQLSQLLDLPPDDRFVRNCSGGQQRRISLAASMVHLPELLILDEPTVGVDPVLRERIWNYLVEVTQTTCMAVVITTHYIEEARKANVIGLMREGRLLAEESPTKLLQIFNTNELEKVFLILSEKQNNGQLPEAVKTFSLNLSQNSINSIQTANGSTDLLTPKKKEKRLPSYTLNKKRVKALMDKNWKQFYRNIAGVVFVVLFPIAVNFISLSSIGTDIKNINLAIVNDESMQTTCHDYNRSATATPIYGKFSTTCHFRNISCRFLDYLDHPMMKKVKYDSLEAAKMGVIHGKVVGVLYIAENFTESFENRIEKGKDVDDDHLNFAQIKVWLDMSNRQIGETLKHKLFALYVDFQKDLSRDCHINPKMVEPVNLETIYGSINDTYTDFMTPGVVITMMFFMMSLMSFQIIINDRLEGLWDRSAIAGVSSLEIVLTHFCFQSVIVVFYTVTVLIITFGIFKIDYTGSIWIMGFIALLQGFAGMIYGFWVSIVSYNFTMANIITTGNFYIMILLCGIMWPLEGMPFALQVISRCLPFTIPIESFRNVMKKGWTLTEFEVWNGVGIEIIWIIGLTLINIWLIKLKR